MAFCYNLKVSVSAQHSSQASMADSILHTAYLLLPGRRGVALTWRETQEKIKCWTHQRHCLRVLLSGLFVLPHYGQDQSEDWLEIHIICFLLCKTFTLYGRKERDSGNQGMHSHCLIQTEPSPLRQVFKHLGWPPNISLCLSNATPSI